MPTPLEGPGLELFAIAAAIAAGAALAALEGALAAFGEVRLLAAQDGGGRDGRTATRILAERTALNTRLLTGRIIALAAAVGVTVHLTAPLGPWWITALVVAAVALLYATLAVGLSAVSRARAATWTLPMARALRPVELCVWPLAAPLSAFAKLLDRRFPPPSRPGTTITRCARWST
ncbi:MAG: CNNM domain-containing protein [Sandaracinaceae bacterium]|nr:CNNM domain-containing protein [Sandaracinaceae bacterium]